MRTTWQSTQEVKGGDLQSSGVRRSCVRVRPKFAEHVSIAQCGDFILCQLSWYKISFPEFPFLHVSRLELTQEKFVWDLESASDAEAIVSWRSFGGAGHWWSLCALWQFHGPNVLRWGHSLPAAPLAPPSVSSFRFLESRDRQVDSSDEEGLNLLVKSSASQVWRQWETDAGSHWSLWLPVCYFRDQFVLTHSAFTSRL